MEYLEKYDVKFFMKVFNVKMKLINCSVCKFKIFNILIVRVFL